MKIGYHINFSKTDKNDFAPIRAKISVDSKAVIKTLPFKVKVTKNSDGKFECKKWNDTKQRLYNFRDSDKYNTEYKKINAFLDKYTAKAQDLFNDCTLNDIKLTEPLVRRFFKGEEIVLNPSKRKFWTVYDEYLKFCETEFRPNTIRMHKSNKSKLEKFEEETGYKMTFDNINLSFFDELKKYILVTKKHGYNYLPSIIKRFKSFMNWSYERKYHSNLEFKKFVIAEKEGSIISLSSEELNQLLYYQFENKTLAKIRDFFCFGCLTGARYSDLNLLTKDNIVDKTLRFTTEKTNAKIVFPLAPEHFEIINRYPEQHKLLPQYENQSLNRKIKEACRIAGIKTITENIVFKRDESKSEFKEKHKLIGSHTARKTFVCLMHENGVDIPTIMALTGIKNQNTIRRYLEVSSDIKETGVNKMLDQMRKLKEKTDEGILKK